MDEFEVVSGIVILDDNLLRQSSILSGTGVPGGDGAEQDNAVLGTTYQQVDAATDSLQTWQKISVAGNDNTDWQQDATRAYVDAVAAGLSQFRAPVEIVDETLYANIAAVELAMVAADELDGVVLVASDRVLITNLTVGAENVYIVGGISGALTLTVDSQMEADGDYLLVNRGTQEGCRYNYTGTEWVKTTANSNAEIQFIRDFIGKPSAGSVLPVYSSNDIITPMGTSTNAIGELDAAIGTLTFTEQNQVLNSADVTTNLDQLDIQQGDGVYSSTNVLVAAQDFTDALSGLDTAIGDRLYTNNTYVTDLEPLSASIESIATQLGNEVTGTNVISVQPVNANIDALDAAIGDRMYTSTILVDGQTLTQSLDLLGVAVDSLLDNCLVTKTAAVVALTTIASVPVADIDIVTWRVSIEDDTIPGNVQTFYVDATHNGLGATDRNTYGRIRVGPVPAGVQRPVVDISGGLMRLRMMSTNGISVSVKRTMTDTYS